MGGVIRLPVSAGGEGPFPVRGRQERVVPRRISLCLFVRQGRLFFCWGEMMEHQCRITVLETRVFPELQEKYLADPKSGPRPCFKPGDTFLLERNGQRDDFWHMLEGRFCAEAWDCVSRYVYAALQGGSIMKGWTNDEKMMIACCNDGTRPVIFKIERIDVEDGAQ